MVEVTHALTTQIVHHGYLAVFMLMLLESACVPVPSEVVMLFGGALSGGLLAQGGHVSVTVWEIALVGAAGNVVGSLIAYGVGRFGGAALFTHRGVRQLIRPKHVRAAENFFARRGSLAVFVGRLLPVIRTFVSLPAGIARMPVGRFTALTAAGCLPWTFALAIAGYYLAGRWDSVAHGFTPVSIVIAVLAFAALIVWWRRTTGDQPQNLDDDRVVTR